jgi:exodeoxyribonuclease III
MQEIRLVSWNVNGIRAAQKKGFLEWLQAAGPDIVCLQETKARPEQLDSVLRQPEGYHSYWNYPERKGYAGVATLSRIEPTTVAYEFPAGELDTEGRVIATEYPDFTLFGVYFPNGGAGLKRLDYKLEFYDRFLDHVDTLKAQGKGVIIAGDVNTAHHEIDLARPKDNSQNTGFLRVERDWLDKLAAHGYVDSFRHFSDAPEQYSYWDMKTRARERNVGWRIDYFWVSENLLPRLTGAWISPDIYGSDHCPIGLSLKTG